MFAEKQSVLDAHVRAGGELSVLLMATSHLSGDFALLKPEWRPNVVFGKLRCDVAPQERERILAECTQRLGRALSADSKAAPLSFDALHRIASWAVGKEIEPYLPLIKEEMVFENGRDLRQPKWTKDAIAPDRRLDVAVIGGGESGIAMAMRLQQAGIAYTLYEKNADFGGTWLENTYPGCRVDINSYVYSYASAPKIWPEYFGQQPEVLSYLKSVANHHGIEDRTSFATEVKSARWDEERAVWDLVIARDGATEIRSHHIVVNAVGQLNRPALPAIEGISDFAGPAFHSARWNHDVDLRGKRVGVIGTGASACQFAPKASEMAEHLTIFSRTTTWLLPTPELHDAVPDSARWLMANVPSYLQWYRASMLFMQGPGLLDRITVDPAYPASETALSEANNVLRASFQSWIEPQIADRPDLRDAVIPTSPVGSKRILRDNGNWIRTLKRDNVRIERGQIRKIVPEGVVTCSGTLHELDVLLYGTGFEAQKFLAPMEIVGRDGRELRKHWGENPRAYLGGTVPGFPNMFTMYGPNTNLVVHGGSIILFSELTAKYILAGIRTLLETGDNSFDVRPEPFEAYNARVDETNARRAWGYSAVNSWYKNSEGRVTQNYPFTIAEYWLRTHSFDSESYSFSRQAGRAS